MKNTTHRDKMLKEQRQALRDLDRLQHQAEVMGASSMIKAAKVIGAKIDDDDPIEILGKRIGRALGIVAVIGLTIYLGVTYF
ncbi:MAG: hypothetical protein QM488_03260 [Rhizobiaceae bacterium]